MNPLLEYRSDLHEEVLWSSDVVRIGTFEARPRDPQFDSAGQVVSAPAIALAREPVKIRWRRHHDLLADVDLAVLHNVGNEYRRVAVSSQGDHTDWFNYSPTILADALERFGLCWSSDVKRPFRHEWAPVDERVCILRAALVHHLREHDPDMLFIEETSLLVLDLVLSGVSGTRAVDADETRSVGDDLATAAREFLSKRWVDPVRLEDVATEVGVSMFHLCRVFRRETGTTLHRHLQQIRLRRSLGQVVETDSDLSTIAFDHGFSSHSHFTSSFRRTFGMTPSAFRRRAASASLQRLLRDASTPS